MLALPARQKLALLRVLTTLGTVEAGLRFLPADRLSRLVGVPLLLSPAEAEPPARATSFGEDRRPELAMLRRVLPYWPGRWGTPCLRQAFTIGILLRRWGPRLRLGVARRDGQVFAHAWVDVAGQSFLADAAFVPLGDSRGSRP